MNNNRKPRVIAGDDGPTTTFAEWSELTEIGASTPVSESKRNLFVGITNSLNSIGPPGRTFHQLWQKGEKRDLRATETRQL